MIPGAIHPRRGFGETRAIEHKATWGHVSDRVAYVVDIYLSSEGQKGPTAGILISKLLEASRKFGYR